MDLVGFENDVYAVVAFEELDTLTLSCVEIGGAGAPPGAGGYGPQRRGGPGADARAGPSPRAFSSAPASTYFPHKKAPGRFQFLVDIRCD